MSIFSISTHPTTFVIPPESMWPSSFCSLCCRHVVGSCIIVLRLGWVWCAGDKGMTISGIIHRFLDAEDYLPGKHGYFSARQVNLLAFTHDLIYNKRLQVLFVPMFFLQQVRHSECVRSSCCFPPLVSLNASPAMAIEPRLRTDGGDTLHLFRGLNFLLSGIRLVLYRFLARTKACQLLTLSRTYGLILSLFVFLFLSLEPFSLSLR